MTAIPDLASEPCAMCGERVEADHENHPIYSVEGQRCPCHRACSLRSVLGGIGHLVDHAYWCGEKSDPDGGLSYRESALRVAEWVNEHGAEETTPIHEAEPA